MSIEPMPEPEPQHDRAPDAGGDGTEDNEHFEWGRVDNSSGEWR